MQTSPSGTLNSRSRGFTLVELAAVTAIMGVMLVVAVPTLRSAVSVGDLEKTARAVIAHVENNRMAAIKTQSPRYFYVDLTGRRIGPFPEGEQEPTDSSHLSGGFPIPQGVVLESVQWPDGSSQSMGVAAIYISAQGYIQHCAIHIADQNRRISLFLEPFLGKVKVTDEHTPMEAPL
ncbi:MAG: prepilin-type N-terminal cleavage/methylation domain-containing protein [Desulfatibacillaceae bacterium]|nr:prepilin-type N-terminal cleavage/methylation domain-containing protein [Desulfatibacillaceae bacterium]